MTTCCGQDRTTPYCPMCGKPLEPESPASELLRYCRTCLKRAASAAERTKAEFGATWPAHTKETFAKQLATAEKWTRWVEALQKLIAESEVKDG